MTSDHDLFFDCQPEVFRQIILVTARATALGLVRGWRPLLLEPRLSVGFRDDREDLDLRFCNVMMISNAIPARSEPDPGLRQPDATFNRRERRDALKPSRYGLKNRTLLGRVASMYISMYIDGMSHRYSIAEARSRLPAIVDQAEAGIEIQLTRRGKPVAAVVSLRVLERLRGGRPRFSTAYRNFLRQYALEEIGLEAGVFAPVREKSPGRKVSL